MLDCLFCGFGASRVLPRHSDARVLLSLCLLLFLEVILKAFPTLDVINSSYLGTSFAKLNLEWNIRGRFF